MFGTLFFAGRLQSHNDVREKVRGIERSSSPLGKTEITAERCFLIKFTALALIFFNLDPYIQLLELILKECFDFCTF